MVIKPNRNIWKSWLPNGFTIGNLIFGFFSIIISAKGLYQYQASDFMLASLLIAIAAAFDGIDGPLARHLGTNSDIGEQLDSLADLTTFGIAPAMFLYALSLHEVSFTIGQGDSRLTVPAGMFLSAIYPAAAAYRLARFNAAHQKKSFTGLPSPVAGLTIALLAFPGLKGIVPGVLFSALLLLALSFLMVSTIPYEKPKPSPVSKRYLFAMAMLVGLALFIVFALKWYWLFYAAIATYILSGILTLLVTFLDRHHLFQNLKVPANDENP